MSRGYLVFLVLFHWLVSEQQICNWEIRLSCYWWVTVLVYSAELEVAHVAQTGWSAVSLQMLLLGVQTNHSLNLCGPFAPVIFCSN